MELLDDRLLIKQIKRKKCSDSILKLREKHAGLVIDIYSRYGSVLHKLNFKPQEFSDEINYLIYDSAKKFDLRRKKIKYSTWLGEQVKYFCLNKINELNKKKTIEAEPDTIIKIINDCYKSENADKKNTQELCNYIFNILNQLKDPRIIKIFKLRFFESGKKGKQKMDWHEIGDKVGLSNQGAINLFNKGLKFLRYKLKNDSIVDKI